MNRRGFLIGMAGAIMAPAIIRPGLLMPIRPALVPVRHAFQLGVDVQVNGNLVGLEHKLGLEALRWLAERVHQRGMIIERHGGWQRRYDEAWDTTYFRYDVFGTA